MNINILNSLLTDYKQTRSLRSAEENLLVILRTKLSSTSWAFRIAVPKVENALSSDIKKYETISIFRKLLKTYMYKQAYEHQYPHTFFFHTCDSMIILSSVSINILEMIVFRHQVGSEQVIVLITRTQYNNVTGYCKMLSTLLPFTTSVSIWCQSFFLFSRVAAWDEQTIRRWLKQKIYSFALAILFSRPNSPY